MAEFAAVMNEVLKRFRRRAQSLVAQPNLAQLAVHVTGMAQSDQPAAWPRGAEAEHAAGATVEQAAVDVPVHAKLLGHAIERVAFADAAEVDLDASLPEVN